MKEPIKIILILLTMISCSKNNCPECNCSSNDWEFVHINSNMQGFFFKKDSYWIFQNDSTKSIDSLIVTKTETGCEAIYLYQGYGYNWEYYKIFYSLFPNHNSYYDMIESVLMQRNRHPSTYPTIQGWNLYSIEIDTNNHYLPIVIDSMIINDKTFTQVQLSHDIFHSSERIDTYIANGIGIIKRVVYTGIDKGNWNLIRWRIVK
jgi:hypothetical protein